jgi:hypothetical protein
MGFSPPLTKNTSYRPTDARTLSVAGQGTRGKLDSALLSGNIQQGGLKRQLRRAPTSPSASELCSEDADAEEEADADYRLARELSKFFGAKGFRGNTSLHLSAQGDPSAATTSVASFQEDDRSQLSPTDAGHTARMDGESDDEDDYFMMKTISRGPPAPTRSSTI